MMLYEYKNIFFYQALGFKKKNNVMKIKKRWQNTSEGLNV